MILAEKVILELASMPPSDVYARFRENDLKDCMKFVRDLQESLNHYAKGKQNVDGVQMNMLSLISYLERKVRRAYYIYMRNRILKERPTMDPKKIKQALNSAWGKFFQAASY